MKRYMLFGSSNYHSLNGGMHEFLEDFDNQQEAEMYIYTNRQEKKLEWCHLYDTTKRKIVFTYKYE